MERAAGGGVAALIDGGERNCWHTVRWVDQVVVVDRVSRHVGDPDVRVAGNVVGEGGDRVVHLLGNETGIERERRVTVEVGGDGRSVSDVNKNGIVVRVIAGVGVERRRHAVSRWVVGVSDGAAASSLVVRSDSRSRPFVAHFVGVGHSPVHGAVREVVAGGLIVHGGVPLRELDLPDTVGVHVHVGDGVNTRFALLERARGPSVARIADALLRVGEIPSHVVAVGVVSADALAVAAAVIGAGLSGAASSLEAREALALAGGAVAGALVGALAVEVAFVPRRSVVVTGQTVVGVVLLADWGVGVLEVHLLVGVDALVSVQVAEGRVDEGLAKVAQALGAIVADETALALASGTGVADTMLVAVVVATGCNLCGESAKSGNSKGVHLEDEARKCFRVVLFPRTKRKSN